MMRPFQTLSLLAVLALSALSTRSVAAADESVSVATATTFVEKLSEASPIIGALAPDFALPDQALKSWKLSEHTGQRAILLLLIAERRRIQKDDSEDAIFEVVRKNALRLQTKNVDVMVATQGTVMPQWISASPSSTAAQSADNTPVVGVNSTKTGGAFGVLRDDGSLVKMYGVVPQRVVGVLIDRHGFLREVNYWPFASETLDAALQNVNAEQLKIEVGKPAPDFAVADADGQWRKLSDLRGRRNVLLTFFPEGSSCGCGSQLPSVENDQTLFRKSDTDIWLLSSDDVESQKELMKTLHASSPFLPDVNKKVALLYGATTNVEEETAGMSVLIDKNGIIRSIDKVSGRLYGDVTLTKMANLPK